MEKKTLLVKEPGFYRLMLMLALPVIIQNMITVGVNIMDTVMLGSFGEIQLSGSSLANDFINRSRSPVWASVALHPFSVRSFMAKATTTM